MRDFLDRPPGKEKNRDITKGMIKFILSMGDISNKYESICTLRNDLNHSGHADNARPVSKAGDFAKDLKELYEAAESILAPA